MPRRRGLRPRLLAAVLRLNATSPFAAERQVVRPTETAQMSSDPSPNPNTVTDEPSFLAFVRELAADQRLAANLEKQEPHRHGAPRGWQNATIEQFLEAAVSWAEDSDFGRRQELGPDASPWRHLAVFLYAGKIYE
jgi:hypothetical protein